jgi:thioredoxin-like negative regulator of GroEL
MIVGFQRNPCCSNSPIIKARNKIPTLSSFYAVSFSFLEIGVSLCRLEEVSRETMALKELNQHELAGLLDRIAHPFALLVYTPLCGTCKLAERMLDIVQATGVAIPMFKININYAPAMMRNWKLSSVPCLALIRESEPIQFEYAMQSVDRLYELIKGLE